MSEYTQGVLFGVFVASTVLLTVDWALRRWTKRSLAKSADTIIESADDLLAACASLRETGNTAEAIAKALQVKGKLEGAADETR